MPHPNQHDVINPLLRYIYENGGKNYQVYSSQTYAPLAEYFDLTEKEASCTRDDIYQDGNTSLYWGNIVQWARMHLKNSGYLASSPHGMWKLSEEGINKARIHVSEKHAFYGIDDIKAIEGYRKDRTILETHRNQELANKRKKQDDYTCQVCKFKLNISDVYIIECHHLNPISIHGVVETSISDLISLCPTCHRIAHLRNPPYTPEEIKKHLANNSISA